jgi:dolichyl-phosphate-mannose-protein mannosyltransferase
MGRQLFLHHYLPALYFAILLLCAVFDFLTSTLRPRWRLQIAALLVIVAIWNFSIFSPLVYGNTWTKGECRDAQWLRTWDFSWYEIGVTVFIISDRITLATVSSTTYASVSFFLENR